MNIIERIEVALEKAKENVFEKHMPLQETDIDIVLVDAKLAIKELKQQISELHASRESLLEYKVKIESEDLVLVPRKPTKEMLKALESGFEFTHSERNYDATCGYEAMIEAVEKEHE